MEGQNKVGQDKAVILIIYLTHDNCEQFESTTFPVQLLRQGWTGGRQCENCYRFA